MIIEIRTVRIKIIIRFVNNNENKENIETFVCAKLLRKESF